MCDQPLKKGQPLNAVLQRCVQVLELVCKAVPGLVEGMYLMGKAKFLSGELQDLITFCVSRRRRKMYCGHACLCVCLSAAVRPHYCTDPDVTWGHGRGCPLVVHYWADLQSGHGLHCYGNITRTLVTSLHPSHNMTT